jgi:hypothetical protein
MRRHALYLAGFLLCAVNCCGIYGQDTCGLAMQPRYSDYVSVSRDGGTIYTTVQVSGYTQVQIEPGCTLTGVTHQGKVYNTISTVGGWVNGPTVWPPNYISVTNSQTFRGTPGTTYPFNWVAEIYCSKIGVFFYDSGNSNILDCIVPSTETTAVERAAFTTMTDFNQTIGDSANDSFNGSTVTEGNAAPGQDTCWGTWSSGPRYTGMTGGSWTVAGGQVLGQPNHWGFDEVGWSTTAVDYYRVQAPAHGVAIPCGLTGYQSLTISCPSGSVIYTPSFGNKLTATIERTDVINCRHDMNNSACQTITY